MFLFVDCDKYALYGVTGILMKLLAEVASVDIYVGKLVSILYFESLQVLFADLG